MLDKTNTKFSHVKPADTNWRSDGLRDFFLYKDLGVADATTTIPDGAQVAVDGVAGIVRWMV